jgi:hypothetical protein
MAVTFLLKRASQAAKVPQLADLTSGELALNFTDGRLYYCHSSGTVAEINSSDARTLGGILPDKLLRNDTNGSLTGNLTVSGTATAASFSGSGASLTSLNGSNISSGTVPIGRLPTGTTSTTVSLGDHNHSTLYVALTGAQTIAGLKTFSNGISDAFVSLISAQLNRTSGNIELQYNKSAASEGVVIFGNRTYASRFVASTGHLGLGTTTPGERLDVAGNVKASGHVRVGTYTTATLPSASTAGAGAIIYVSDHEGGTILGFSDGTNWRRSDTRAIIAAA